MGKPVRMADIAKELDISVVSVSKALSGKPGVSEELRSKIVALAQQMGYETTREPTETGNIGVLVAERFFSDNAFYAKLYSVLAMKASKEGFTCMLEIVPKKAEQEAIAPALLTGRSVDGIIFLGNLSPGYLKAMTASGLPYLFLDFRLPGCGESGVISDNLDGGFMVTKHLLELGYREIAFVGSIQATSSIMERYLGYLQALHQAGIVPREDWVLEDREKEDSNIVISLPDQLPQAFVCNCDEVAFHLVEMLEKAGYRVPEDVAVTGHDDFRFATMCHPPLTTYRVDVERMAEVSISYFVQKQRQEPVSPMLCVIPGQLVIRESTIGTSKPSQKDK